MKTTQTPSKGASPFSSMGDITVYPKAIAKLLDRLNVHKASGLNGLNAKVLINVRAMYQMTDDKQMFLQSLKR